MKQEKKTVRLYTESGERLCNELAGEIPWNTYPRPHLARNSFYCLNGDWAFETCPRGEVAKEYTETIRVPFVPQSCLSGIGRRIPQGMRLCYQRQFRLPDGFARDRVLLHIGAADQIAEVFLNGKRLGEHRGGYDSFCFDMTDALKETNTLTVYVTDELDRRILPYGKQCERRGGMWYTPISGIWQTVWVESVPENYVRELRVTSYRDRAEVEIEPRGEGTVLVHFSTGDREFPLRQGRAVIAPEDPILWTPDNPYLYRFTLRMEEDEVQSYFALRSLEIQEVRGVPRLCLNGEPIFFHGLLDQGYFSDGIFLPATSDGYEGDILLAKGMGFNMLRKHIKIEPEQFYYDCDRLGMVVFQDMVNNGKYSFFRDTALPTVGLCRRDDRRMHRDRATREAFLATMEKTVRRLSFHPSVFSWTIFNEGWGQFDHRSAYERLKRLDDSRWIDSVSGWFLPPRGRKIASDVESLHVYFKPVRLSPSHRPAVLSEFGGYAHKIEGHAFNPNKNYGYRFFSKREELEDALEALYKNEILPAVREGLCACVYTQLSDVEDETNGLVTYDRRVRKVDGERMHRIADQLQEAIRQ